MHSPGSFAVSLRDTASRSLVESDPTLGLTSILCSSVVASANAGRETWDLRDWPINPSEQIIACNIKMQLKKGSAITPHARQPYLPVQLQLVVVVVVVVAGVVVVVVVVVVVLKLLLLLLL